MSILDNISKGISILSGRSATTIPTPPSIPLTETEVFLAAVNEAKKRILDYKPKAIPRTRKDIKSWKDALASAEAEEPKNFALQLIYDEAMNDGLLSSQIENRQTKLFGIDWNLKDASGTIDEEQTLKLKDFCDWRELTRAILETHYFEYNLVELSLEKNMDGIDMIDIQVLPRTNVVPLVGKYYPDYTEDTAIDYRNMKEFGVWILEFNSKKRGLINKAVKHVLLKDFAQSCWGELCEIYGIPPRFMKTDTQDPKMLDRAERMMADMGAAAWFIIDQSEEFEFAEGVTSSGDVYNSLIRLCNNEMSMLVSGAIIGQDTVNGNRSKDESSQNVLWDLVLQDLVTSQDSWNKIILPALKKIGFIKGDVRFKYSIPEDLDELWKRVVDALPHFEIDPDWIKDRFGIEITGKKEVQSNQQLNLGHSFFD